MKTCRRCSIAQPIEAFNRHARRPDGLRDVCKVCQAAENRESYERHAEKRRAEARVRSAEWRAKPGNAERNRVGASAWAERNLELNRARTRAWSAANPEQKKAADKAWREANRGRVNALIRAYKSAKIQRTPAWADLDAIRSIYEEAARISHETGARWDVDHVVPLQGRLVSGLHVPHNLRIISGRENMSKGNRHWPDMP